MWKSTKFCIGADSIDGLEISPKRVYEFIVSRPANSFERPRLPSGAKLGKRFAGRVWIEELPNASLLAG